MQTVSLPLCEKKKGTLAQRHRKPSASAAGRLVVCAKPWRLNTAGDAPEGRSHWLRAAECGVENVRAGLLRRFVSYIAVVRIAFSLSRAS